MRVEPQPQMPSQKQGSPQPDTVEEANRGSFPASDAPSHNPTTVAEPPVGGPVDIDPTAERPLEVVHEHPISDPASRSKDP